MTEWEKGPAGVRPEKTRLAEELQVVAVGSLLQLLDDVQCPAEHPWQ